MFPHRRAHKYVWTFLLMSTRTTLTTSLQIKRTHGNTTDVRPFGGARCDTKHYHALAKVRESSLSKHAQQDFDMENPNLRKITDLVLNTQHEVKTASMSAAFENINSSVPPPQKKDHLKVGLQKIIYQMIILQRIFSRKLTFFSGLQDSTLFTVEHFATRHS